MISHIAEPRTNYNRFYRIIETNPVCGLCHPNTEQNETHTHENCHIETREKLLFLIRTHLTDLMSC